MERCSECKAVHPGKYKWRFEKEKRYCAECFQHCFDRKPKSTESTESTESKSTKSTEWKSMESKSSKLTKSTEWKSTESTSSRTPSVCGVCWNAANDIISCTNPIH